MPSATQALAESFGSERSSQPRSLWQLLQEGVDKNPNGLALACPHHATKYLSPSARDTNGYHPTENGEAHGNLEWSYSQLSRYAEHFAKELQQHGAQCQGATIVPFLPSGPEWALVFWTAAKLSMPIAAVDPKVLFSEETRSGGNGMQDSYVKTLRPHIVIVQDDLAASVFDEACARNDHTPVLKVIVDPDSTLSRPLSDERKGWVTLDGIIRSSPVSETNGHSDQTPGEATPDPEAVARILFTGGSTGDPKGCPHTHANLTAESDGFNTLRGLTTTSRTLVQSPAHHIMANAAALLTWRAGAGVIFPFKGNKFDAGDSIKAIKAYKCTYLPVHHSMSDSILRHPSFNKGDVESVRYMQIGGALIGSSLAQSYSKAFGVAKDGTGRLEIFPFWGSTEGMYTTACVKGDTLIADNEIYVENESSTDSSDVLAVGRAYLGGRVKVVDPDTGATKHRGQSEKYVGELHFGGDTVINQYVGGVSPDSFYTQDGFSWFRTGDQGRMADDGSIFMLGRYKDMIKRGGENIFPQQLEYTLLSVCSTKVSYKPTTLPTVQDADNPRKAQIIGIPDAITGEACVAVVDTSKSEQFSKLQLQVDVSKHIGSEFVFVHILTLEELGLAQYPVGPGGKVRKPILKELVLNHLEKTKKQVPRTNGYATPNGNSNYNTMDQHGSLDLVKSVWADLLHIDASQFGDDFRLEHFTDSLTAMRYCFEIEKLTSKRLTVADVRDAPTIRDQAKLVSGAPVDMHVTGKTDLDVNKRTGPPLIEDIPICRGQESKFLQIKDLATAVLGRHGLNWERDVQDCFPSPPLLAATVLLPATRSFNLRFAFEVRGLEFSEIRDAVVEILKVQPLLLSAGINLENKLVYVQLRQNEDVIERFITKERELDSVDAAVDFGLHEPFEVVARPTELLSRFGIFPVPSQDATQGPVHVIIMSLAHNICDGMTNSVVIAALEAQLRMRSKKAGDSVKTPPAPRFLPYKLFADMYDSLDNSVSATTSAKLVASKFHGIHEAAGASWPSFDPKKMLSIFAADVGDSTEIFRGGIMIQRSGRAPGILSLQDTHGIPPSIALKVAYGLAVMQMTGKKSALYLHVDAARHWPFQDTWTQSFLPNPLLIGGPTVVLTWEWLKLGAEGATLLDVFRGVQDKDAELAPHSHMFQSYDAVTAHLPAEDAAFVRDTRCFDPKIALNHVPDVGRFTGADGLKALKLKGTAFYGTGVTPLQSGFDAGDRELCVIAGLVDGTHWEYPEGEVGGFEETILRTLGEIVKPENWNEAAVRFAKTAEA
ncbi:putative NRPS-like protein biosynthetic cluster [Diaporthe australafricana]|uniref:NRPS-like protein biosynthetic cluster n=1 Tax=Diaporthe australafricana TaxID=127596 RepID=A0ABR3W6P3_9PEZI